MEPQSSLHGIVFQSVRKPTLETLNFKKIILTETQNNHHVPDLVKQDFFEFPYIETNTSIKMNKSLFCNIRAYETSPLISVGVLISCYSIIG